MDNDIKKENGTKVGLDDYLCNHSIDEFNQLPCIAFDNFDICDIPLIDIFDNAIQECPYPFEVFPEKLQKVINETAEALSVEPELVAHTKITLISGAIGNSTRISSKPSHIENLQIWGQVIGDTGSGKTPAINQCIRPIEDKQAEAAQRYREELRNYKQHLEQCKTRKKSETVKPSDGVMDFEQPIFRQHIINDTTVEANVDVFRDQPRGAILHRDELSGWILGMNQYKRNKGSDKQHYLEIYNGNPITVNRVTTGIKYAPNTGLAIIGGLTPNTVTKIFSYDDIDDGFLPRFIFIHAGKMLPYNNKTISEDSLNYWKAVIDYCYNITLKIDEKTCRVNPIILTLNPESFEAYLSFRNEYNQVQELLPKRIGSFLPKLLTYCLKFAGVIHILRAFESNKNISTNIIVDAHIMKDAIRLTRYYTYQVVKLVRLYDTPELKPHQKRLVEILFRLQDEVKNGRLYLKRIAELYNDRLPEPLILDERHIGIILRKELNLRTNISHNSYLIWDEKELKRYFREMSKLSKLSKQDDDLQYDSIPEVEFAEEVKTNV